MRQHRMSRVGRNLHPGSSPLQDTSRWVRCGLALSVGHGRWMGSFHKDNQDDGWYRESLRTVLADLRRELEPVGPIEQLHPILEGKATVSNFHQAGNRSHDILPSLPPVPTTNRETIMDAASQPAMAPLETTSKLQQSPQAATSDLVEDLQTIQDWTNDGSPGAIALAFRRLDQVILSDTSNGMADHVLTSLVGNLLRSWKKLWLKKATDLRPTNVVPILLTYHDRRNGFLLDSDAYNTLLLALAYDTDRQQSIPWWQHLFERMQQDSKNGNIRAAPNSQTYECLIRVYAQAGHIQGALDLLLLLRDRPKKALQDAIQVKLFCFRPLLKACLLIDDTKQLQNLGELAEGILDLLTQLDDAGRLVRQADYKQEMGMIYAKVVECWQKSEHPDAPRKIAQTLQKLERLTLPTRKP